jgi:membrane protein YqaA with SNARE-associated domain
MKPKGYYKNNLSVFLSLNSMSQAHLAQAVGSSVGSVNHWVLGRAKPNRFVMHNVLTVLGRFELRTLDAKEVWEP